MQYFGGKARIAKPLSAFLNSKLKPNQPFVDAFCGSCNVISKIEPNRVRIANDLHEPLVDLFKYLQSGGDLPTEISEDFYKEVKNNPDHPLWLKAFVGFGCSYSGKYFGGYARGGKNRNYASNAKNSLVKKMQGLSGVEFTNGNYDQIIIPDESLIYCDIPYKNSVGYSVGNFNHDHFYKWVKAQNSDVYISEYAHNVPRDAIILWEFNSKKDIRNREGLQESTLEVLFKF